MTLHAGIIWYYFPDEQQDWNQFFIESLEQQFSITSFTFDFTSSPSTLEQQPLSVSLTLTLQHSFFNVSHLLSLSDYSKTIEH